MRFSPQSLLGNYWIAQPYRSRYQSLQRLLHQEGVSTLWIEDPALIYHFTHQRFSQAILLASASQPFELWLDGRYYEGSASRGWSKYLWDHEGPENIFRQLEGKEVHCEEGLSYARVEKIRAWASKAGVKLAMMGDSLERVRMVKDAPAIASLERSARLNDEGFRFLRTLLAPGVSEVELARELEVYWLRHGGEGTAFEPIIAFGPNSALPHHHSGQRRLRTGDLVLVDLGVTVDGYQSDMTRSFFFGLGEGVLQEVLESVERAYRVGVSSCRAGVTTCAVDAKVRESLRLDGYEGFFTHSLGHGIGLEVHEPPYFRKGRSLTLMEGMVLTIEPGVYLQGKGGVRLENTVVVEKEGARVLSQVPIVEESGASSEGTLLLS